MFIRRLVCALLLMLPLVGGAAAPLQVVCSVPELGALAQEIGGDRVAVTVCVKPREDPHSLEARPALIRALATADAWVQVGCGLETGWAPKLLEKARNPGLRPGQPGFIDGSTVVSLHRHAAPVDRSMGDVHPEGNPHYLVDPVCGLRVAELLAARLTQLDPASAALYAERLASFRSAFGVALVGPALAATYPADKLAVLAAAGSLGDFLAQSQETAAVGGWLAQLAPYRGQEVAADHDAWAYFTDRFGLRIAVYLEPKPGMAPTTRHLAATVATMKERQIHVLIAAPYFAARHHSTVARATGATVAALAHQVDSRPDTGSYLAMIDYNVATLAAALAEGQP